MAGSVSLSPLNKWHVAEYLPDLSAWQVSELLKAYSEELVAWGKQFGEATAQALWQAQLAGHTNVIQDITFWEQRIHEYGLAGDYFGFQDILATFYVDTHAERLIEIIDQLLQQYGESDNPAVQEQCADALFNKGVTLGEKLNDSQGAVDAYNELLHRYGESDNPAIQELCADALFNKGVTLDVKLNNPQHAVNAYNELLHHYGESDNPAIQERCAKALVSKGVTLGRLADLPAAIACFETLLVAYSQSDNPTIQEQCLLALSNLPELLLVIGRREQAIERMQQILAQVNTHDQQSAIMPFLLWLAEVDITIDEVIAAIRALSPEVQFNWGFSEIRPLVKQLTPSRLAQAESFMAFFEDHHDLSQLINAVLPEKKQVV